MRIIFDPTTLHQSKMGAVTGVVYFDFGPDQRFPVEGWSDFVVVVASWWLAALEELDRGADETKLRFMDGPYWVAVVPQDASSVLLRCTEDRKGAGVATEELVDRDVLRSELQKLGNEVLRACAEARIESRDLDGIRSYLMN